MVFAEGVVFWGLLAGHQAPLKRDMKPKGGDAGRAKGEGVLGVVGGAHAGTSESECVEDGYLPSVLPNRNG